MDQAKNLKSFQAIRELKQVNTINAHKKIWARKEKNESCHSRDNNFIEFSIIFCYANLSIKFTNFFDLQQLPLFLIFRFSISQQECRFSFSDFITCNAKKQISRESFDNDGTREFSNRWHPWQVSIIPRRRQDFTRKLH